MTDAELRMIIESQCAMTSNSDPIRSTATRGTVVAMANELLDRRQTSLSIDEIGLVDRALAFWLSDYEHSVVSEIEIKLLRDRLRAVRT